jgi:NAD(P)-dependent dehydrogenase (short-subunit alcohol dehydrogenase family)
MNEEQGRPVVVVVGLGDMGMASARRLGSGCRLVVADVDSEALEAGVAQLADDGYDVSGETVDVSNRSSLEALAEQVRDLGPLRSLVHTAGLSPTQGAPGRIIEVNLLGVVHALQAFESLAIDGSVAVFISSIGAYFAGLRPDDEARLAAAELSELSAGLADELGLESSNAAYCAAKRIAMLRVERATPAWGARGARVLTISPGIISTKMARREREFQTGTDMQLAAAPMHRIGTAHDIAAAVEWLSSPAASYITGCDLRVDGGVVAAFAGFVVTEEV